MYEQGIDAKIVIMGNTGKFSALFISVLWLNSLSRSGKDQFVTAIYPRQVRPTEYDFHNRSLLRHKEGL